MDAGGKEVKIYVDIDALLDVRLSIVASIDPVIASDLAIANSYIKRTTDVFDGIDAETYSKAYAKRNAENLSKAMMTECVAFLGGLVKDVYTQAMTGPHYDKVVVVLNTAPYQLDRETSSELGIALSTWMCGFAEVEVVHIPVEHLTPIHCKAEYSVMIKYEYDEWMSYHTVGFASCSLYDIILYAPALYTKEPGADDFKEAEKYFGSVFSATEKLAAPLIKLQLLPAEVFSIVQ